MPFPEVVVEPEARPDRRVLRISWEAGSANDAIHCDSMLSFIRPLVGRPLALGLQNAKRHRQSPISPYAVLHTRLDAKGTRALREPGSFG